MQTLPRGQIYFLWALGLVSIFVYSFAIGAVSLIFNFSIGRLQFTIACLLSLLTLFAACRFFAGPSHKKTFLKITGYLFCTVFIGLLIAGSMYDTSFDGQWYHQETVYQLKSGWNPYREEIPVPKKTGLPVAKEIWCSGPHIPPTENQNGQQKVTNIKYLNINYFAKGVEIAEAVLYGFTNRIETAKAFNILICMASFLLCLAATASLGLPKGRWTRLLISLAFSSNPVTISQITSFCVDGILGSLLLCLLAVFVLLLRDHNKWQLIVLGMLIPILLNVKFTAIAFTGVYLAGFLFYLLIGKNRILLRKVSVTVGISLICGICFFGFHPYLTNLIHHRQVFYSLDETRQEISEISPTYFSGKNRLEKFMIGFGARSFDQSANAGHLSQIIKIPFSISKREWLNANNQELEVAGFGPFFGGALLLTGIIFVVLLLHIYDSIPFRNGMIVLLFLLLSVFIIPEPWWARFAPQIWLIPVILFMVALYDQKMKPYLKWILYLAVFLNIVWVTSGQFFNLSVSAHIRYQLKQLKSSGDSIRIEYCGYRDLSSNRIRLIENHIPFREGPVTGPHIYNIIHSNTRFETKEELPDLPKSWILRMGEIWKKSVD